MALPTREYSDPTAAAAATAAQYSFGILMWEILTRDEPYKRNQDLKGIQIAYAAAEQGIRPAIPTYCPEKHVAARVATTLTHGDARLVLTHTSMAQLPTLGDQRR